MHVGLVALADLDYALDVAHALDGAGVRVSLYLAADLASQAVGDSARPAERMRELGLIGPTVQVRLFDTPRQRDPRSFLVARRIARSMKEDRLDVAHVQNGAGELWSAIVACLLSSLPVVGVMKEPRPNTGGYSLPYVWTVDKLLALASDVIVVLGQEHVALVERMYRVPAGRVLCVPLGPRTTAARWATSRVPEEEGTVLFFGRVERYKGLEYLVKAQPSITSRVPHARVVVAGRGDDLERCLGMIQDPSRFEIHGKFVANDQAAELLQRASVVALPYVSASTSGIIVTAYAFGKPVVVTRVGCLPEYVEPGVTGLIVPPEDAEKLADAVVALLADPDRRRRMGENAARWVVGEMKRTAAQWLGAYERAICVHRSPKH